MDDKKLTTRIKPLIHAKLKMMASFQGITLSDCLERLIEQRFKELKLSEPRLPKEVEQGKIDIPE